MHFSQSAVLVAAFSAQTFARSTSSSTTHAITADRPAGDQENGVYHVSFDDDGNKSVHRLGGMSNFTAFSNSAKFRRDLGRRDAPDTYQLGCQGPGAGSFANEDAAGAAQALGATCDAQAALPDAKPWVNARGYTYGLKNGVWVYFCNYSKQPAFCYSGEMNTDMIAITQKCSDRAGESPLALSVFKHPSFHLPHSMPPKLLTKLVACKRYSFRRAGEHNLDISYGIASEDVNICPTLKREGQSP